MISSQIIRVLKILSHQIDICKKDTLLGDSDNSLAFAHALGFSLLTPVFLFSLRGILRYSNFS